MSRFSMFGHIRTQRGQRPTGKRTQSRNQPQFVQRPSPTPTPSPEPQPPLRNEHHISTRQQQSLELLGHQSLQDVVDPDNYPLDATHRTQPAGEASVGERQFGTVPESAIFIQSALPCQERRVQRGVTGLSARNQDARAQRDAVDTVQSRSRDEIVSVSLGTSVRQGEQQKFTPPTSTARRELMQQSPVESTPSQRRSWFAAPTPSDTASRANDMLISSVEVDLPLQPLEKQVSSLINQPLQQAPNRHLLGRTSRPSQPDRSTIVRARTSQLQVPQPISPLFEPQATEPPKTSRRAKKIGPLQHSDEEEAEEYDEIDNLALQSTPNHANGQSKVSRKKRSTQTRGERKRSVHPARLVGRRVAQRRQVEVHTEEQEEQEGQEKSTARPKPTTPSRTAYSYVDIDSILYEDTNRFQEDINGASLPVPFPSDDAPTDDFRSKPLTGLIKPTYEHLLTSHSRRSTRSGKTFHMEIPESEGEYADDPSEQYDFGYGERRIRIRHRMMANLDAEVLPFPHPYYLLLRRSLRGRNWRRSPVKYATQMEAGNPRDIFPLTIEGIKSKDKMTSVSKKNTVKSGPTRPKLRAQSSLDFVETPEYASDVPQYCPDKASYSPGRTRRKLHKRIITLVAAEMDNQTFEDSQAEVQTEQKCATALVVQNGLMKRKIDKLECELKNLLEKNLVFNGASEYRDGNVSNGVNGQTTGIHGEIRRLNDEIDRLGEQNTRLEEDNSELVKEMDVKVAELNKRIERLNGQLKAIYHKSASNQQAIAIPVLDIRSPTKSVYNISSPATAVVGINDQLEAANLELKRKYEALELESAEMGKKCEIWQSTAKQVLTFGNMMANENFGDLGVALLKLRGLIQKESG